MTFRPPENTTAADVFERLKQSNQAELQASASDASRERDAYRTAAAMQLVFDPDRLNLLADAAPSRAAREYLREDVIVLPSDESGDRWTLRPEVRATLLKNLTSSQERRQAFESGRPASRSGADGILARYLAGGLPRVETLGLEDSKHLLQVINAFDGILPALPKAAEVRERLARLRELEPFRILADRFVGRERELTRLREYVGVLPPGSPQDAMIRQAKSWLGLRRPAPLWVSGIGGVGKSALIARFLLDHVDVDDSVRVPHVYLDCDEYRVTGLDGARFAAECARRLQIWHPRELPDADAQADRVLEDAKFDQEQFGSRRRSYRTEKVQREVAVGRPSLEFVENQMNWVGELLARIRPMSGSMRGSKSSAPVGAQPLLVILDTFERVQYGGPDAVDHLWRSLELLHEAVPGLRLVISGRAPASDRRFNGNRVDTLDLKDLDDLAAEVMLRAEGVTDPSMARAILRLVGGTPLCLKLAANLVMRTASTRTSLEDLKTRSWFGLSLDREVVQGQLYRRILDHIRDDDVRKLAHPGLVVRRIDTGVLRHVLAEPCEVAIPDEERADELMELFRREVSLVSEEADGSLRHRPDVRRVMLRIITRERPNQVKQIHENAIEHYAMLPGTEAKVEEVYHRLQRGDDLAEIEKRWDSSLGPGLEEATEELPPRSRYYLELLLGLSPSRSRLTEEVVPVEREQALAVRVDKLLLDGNAPAALEELRHARPYLPDSPLYLLEAEAQIAAGAYDDADAALVEAIEVAARTGDYVSAFEAAILEGRSAEDRSRVEEARSAYERALGVAEQLADEIRLNVARSRLLGAVIALLRTLRSMHGWDRDERRNLQSQAADLFGKLPLETRVRIATVTRETTALVGIDYPSVLVEGLRCVGMGHLEDDQIETLATTMADVCERRDVGGDLVQGAILSVVGSQATRLPLVEIESWLTILRQALRREQAIDQLVVRLAEIFAIDQRFRDGVCAAVGSAPPTLAADEALV